MNTTIEKLDILNKKGTSDKVLVTGLCSRNRILGRPIIKNEVYSFDRIYSRNELTKSKTTLTIK